ncbi:MAG: hypothetical protein IJK35_01350 [Oscillospiraceae bacterium]|nr:hypothetical protein [Oscillospiraceae bacterium]
MILSWLDRGALPLHPLRRALPGQKRVACVGDSITYGYGVESWRKNNYPAVLGTLLGEGYCVNNFGFSGATASSFGDTPYTEESVYRQSLAFRPDLVLLMLGTNDTKPYNWKGEEHYLRSCREILRAYRELSSRPELILLAPPPAWGLGGAPVAFEISASLLSDALRPALRSLAAEENVRFLDVYGVLEGRPELFFDGVHPNAAGARLLAETVYQTIKEKEQRT